MLKTSKPLIGVVPDYENGGEKGYSKRPYYAIRKNYIDCIRNAGGVPIILPYDYELMDDYLASIDGLLIIGGDFDVHPKRYGEEVHHTVKLNDVRGDFEYELAAKALKGDLPFFGICNGMQLLNIVYGGSAIQHIPDEPAFMNHEQSKVPGKEDPHHAYHDVKITKNSKLFSIAGEEIIPTNSAHHQAVKKIGDGLTVAAIAEDGIVEAIEKSSHPFCIGTQWHPEYEVSEADRKIFQAFINAAQSYKN
jgi:putative glutamine amidotransferase